MALRRLRRQFITLVGLTGISFKESEPHQVEFPGFNGESKGTEYDLVHYDWQMGWHLVLLREFKHFGLHYKVIHYTKHGLYKGRHVLLYFKLHCKAISYAKAVKMGVTQRNILSYILKPCVNQAFTKKKYVLSSDLSEQDTSALSWRASLTGLFKIFISLPG